MSEKSVEAAAELSAKDLKEKKEKVEEKASRKERKKEVVESPVPLVVMVGKACSQPEA
ncbi:PTMS isoform 7, partial [Pan troglodytes]